MHDPLTVAFEILRPWPSRSPLAAAGDRDVRWRMRLHHTHLPMCSDDPPHGDGPFPWWKTSSYSRFWRIAGRDYYWPALIRVWHREPGARDALTECGRVVQRPDGTWRRSRGWRLHVRHWRLQIPPLQQARRRLLTRCTLCGGRSTKTHPISLGTWGGSKSPWWRGETGLRHMDCADVRIAEPEAAA